MSDTNIYGQYYDSLKKVTEKLSSHLMTANIASYEAKGKKLFEHLNKRIKSEESMREKCKSRNLPETPYSALVELHDAIGIRIVCAFVDDIYENIKVIKEIPNVTIIEEKDYITHAKPNGYRSYHLILCIETDFEDVCKNVPGKYYAEIQLRTIAMDSWASLEHELKYKKNISNQELIVSELKRCADELASCDISMQTIRNLIHES